MKGEECGFTKKNKKKNINYSINFSFKTGLAHIFFIIKFSLGTWKFRCEVFIYVFQKHCTNTYILILSPIYPLKTIALGSIGKHLKTTVPTVYHKASIQSVVLRGKNKNQKWKIKNLV